MALLTTCFSSDTFYRRMFAYPWPKSYDLSLMPMVAHCLMRCMLFMRSTTKCRFHINYFIIIWHSWIVWTRVHVNQGSLHVQDQYQLLDCTSTNTLFTRFHLWLVIFFQDYSWWCQFGLSIPCGNHNKMIQLYKNNIWKNFWECLWNLVRIFKKNWNNLTKNWEILLIIILS